MRTMKAELVQKIQKTLEKLGVAAGNVSLDVPGNNTHGDYATGVALAVAKQAGMPPRATAEKIVAELGTIKGVEKIEIAGPGFINFFLSTQALVEAVAGARTNEWGRGNFLKDKTILCEYTDPNPFKAFHIGHLMSNTIGESLARLCESQGATVVRANYQGDLGVHVACAIWGIKKLGIHPESADEFGAAYAAGATAYKEDETAKTQIDALNKKLYDRSDAELNELYDSGRKASLDAFEAIYAILGTKFNRYYFESETAPVGKEIVLAHPEIFPESDGARVFKGEDYGLHTRVFLNKQGLPTYEAKELGLEKMKQDEYPHSEKFIIVTANEITEYFKVLKKAMEQVLPSVAAKLLHVPHGMMKLQSGKMSSRTGSVITGESLLGELKDAALERAKESRAENHELLAQQIAVAAIKFQVLKGGTSKDIIFDRERSLSLEGDSGPYLQYAHARCTSLLEKGKSVGITPVIDAFGVMPDFVRHLVHFPEVVERAASEYEPHHVATFLIELASQFNAWYAQEKIMDTPDTAHKLALVDAVRQTLQNGLWVLGISAPEKM
ncbi:arginine--tRNA ligase [bacterium]|nr:arginine--tRNA ligase [bacterium]